ncbi:MAG: hypothetical protein EA397_17130 [Deltaproteobacteria bacterium]|nr:MAG: hypothetical protein EA397_17130 [Deltaproteobacteria bacterium]
MTSSIRSIQVEGGPSLPMLVFDGPHAGPCALVTANLHGDELTGLAACQRLASQLPEALRAGRVVLIPSLNPEGLVERSRTVPADGGDLNRCFPGRRRGRAAERLAAAIWRELRSFEPDVVLDLHADSARSIPYVLLDRPTKLSGRAGRAMLSRLEALGASSGLTVVREYEPELYARYSLDKSLSGALVNRAQVPALTLEAGPRRGLDPPSIRAMADGVWGVLSGLGLVESPPAPHPSRIVGPLRRVVGPRAPVAGWWDPFVQPGERIDKARELGAIRRIDGRVSEVLVARDAGWVLSWVDAAWISAGGAVGTLAVEEAP